MPTILSCLLPHAHHFALLCAGEQHGFRRGPNIELVTNMQFAFLARVCRVAHPDVPAESIRQLDENIANRDKLPPLV